ncbi:MAG: hypothetical protein Q7J54_04390 [Candidatus Woesearchaeota archaeon]|nr:hypothetical protein [Candidatus Woesearchaeota archaeon]
MTAVLCFGNEFLENDSLAKKIADEIKLEGFEFIKTDNVDDILNYANSDELYILDVVENIRKTVLIKNIDDLKSSKICTLHDFDLGFYLKLMKEIGKIKEIRIIGIPQEGNTEEIKKEVIDILRK